MMNGSPGKENIQSPSLRELREEDFHDIYRSVSVDSKKTSKSSKSDNADKGVIPNAFLFFSKGDDKEELRYLSDEEEDKDRHLYEPKDGDGDGDGENNEAEANGEGKLNGTDNGTENVGNGTVGNGAVANGTMSNGAMANGTMESGVDSGDPDASGDPVDPNATIDSKQTHFLPQMFARGDQDTDDKNVSPRPKRKFQFFRKKGPKDKDHRKLNSITAMDDEEYKDDKDIDTGERAKQVIGALSVGAPSISLVASCLLEDEHGISRAPLLLSLLGFRVIDISNTIQTKNRKFRIDLEYGVGPQRMRWSVEKTAKDLLYLHSKFKFDNWRKEVVRNRYSELPKYPIPPLRTGNEASSRILPRHKTFKYGHRSPNDITENGHDTSISPRAKTPTATSRAGSPELPNNNSPTNEEPSNIPSDLINEALQKSAIPKKKAKSPRIEDNNHLNTVISNQSSNYANSVNSDNTLRRLASLRLHLSSSSSSMGSDDQSPEQLRAKMIRNQEYIIHVSNYLNDLIKLVALKPQSNRLFHFFEISPISSLLSYETGYIGKQGVAHIGGTAKSQGWRVGHFKANDLKGMIDRRQEKWLLIRNSYIMYVDEINSTLPLDVFMVDSKFRISHKGEPFSKTDPSKDGDDDDESDYDDILSIEKDDVTDNNDEHTMFKHLKITVENSERKMNIIPKSIREQRLWLKSLEDMKNSTVWSKRQRFDSFAPVRDNCYAQWFVDGRDYFWALSSALEMAKDVIYIHDWWLSPELYLRRPANGNQQWRLDRLLQRKAKQGVKIFVIVYRNVGSTVSTDSLYTKHSLLSLHDENIHVIRSPNQLLQNTYFWAHHEKLCIIDQTVAFIGGIDLCYGRYDTPDHVIVDDSKINFAALEQDQTLTEEDYVKFQVFPGKDYSNARVKDFYSVDKPYESMYDRDDVPRMPWHDVHMLTSGKVARDLARHFVQRWNYLLRQKRPSRFTPLLTPPSDFTEEEERQMKLGGSCEIQLLRSSGAWSLGLKEHEQSIQDAYLKLIETSEHFVYMENQFFITSTVIDGNEIENRIGDALVDRIIRAHDEGTNWRAVIIIPLMPGFESQVDRPDGSSVRVIMECQYMSISRGLTSIFGKLRKYGIDPEDYIQFFSLRKWGRIGPNRNLVTEQLYVHAKIMIVDDRAAIIGSANVNERSMRGVRDSEMAALVRDKETVSTKMDGKDYLAGKFAHSLRIRLMREHLGVNVDIVDIVERRFTRFEEFATTSTGLKAATNRFNNRENAVLSAMVELASRDILMENQGTFRWKHFQDTIKSNVPLYETPLEDINELETQNDLPAPIPLPISFNNRTGTHEANRGIRDRKKHSYDARVQHSEPHKRDVYGHGLDKYKSKLAKRTRLNNSKFLKSLAHKVMQENPLESFLPDLENVAEFLESDDYDMTDEMDEESERIITERNKERWSLLKKLSYLQRVHAYQKEQDDEEGKKRVAANIPSVNNGTQNGTTKETSKDSRQDSRQETRPESSRQTKHNHSSSKDLENNSSQDGNNIVSTVEAAEPKETELDNEFDRNLSLPDKKQNEQVMPEQGDDIPIISLSENGAKSLFDTINPKHIDKFSTFIDPYGFEDPVDEDFYEDMWFEHARRNTEIFRTVFHTQPDDTVLSWRDYKRFSKLQSAFALSQKQEVKRRKNNLYNASSLSESDSDENESNYHNQHENRKGSINVDAFNGVLDNGQPSTNFENPELSKRLSLKFVYKANQKDDDSSTINGSETGDNNRNTLNHQDDPIERKAHRKRSAFSARKKAALGDRIYDRQTAERILNEIQGNLVFFPTEWLLRELEGGNWFYNTDRIPPIDIYD